MSNKKIKQKIKKQKKDYHKIINDINIKSIDNEKLPSFEYDPKTKSYFLLKQEYDDRLFLVKF